MNARTTRARTVPARHPVRRRFTGRVAGAVAAATTAVLVGGGTLVAGATPALAIGERGDPGGHLTWVQTLLMFLGIPLAAFVVIAFLVYLPSLVRGPRYRPGRPWTAGSVWFGGPADPDTAVAEVTSLPSATIEGGGASARW